MKLQFNTNRFLRTLAGFAVLILGLDLFLTHFFDIGEPKQSIIEIFGALILFEIIREVYRRYKIRQSK